MSGGWSMEKEKTFMQQRTAHIRSKSSFEPRHGNVEARGSLEMNIILGRVDKKVVEHDSS